MLYPDRVVVAIRADRCGRCEERDYAKQSNASRASHDGSLILAS
jgi:hypothetical protein